MSFDEVYVLFDGQCCAFDMRSLLATHQAPLQHTATHLNAPRRDATHSAALFGYECPVQVSFNKVPPISAPQQKVNAGRRADVSIGTEENECAVVLCYLFGGVCLRAHGWVWLIQ